MTDSVVTSHRRPQRPTRRALALITCVACLAPAAAELRAADTWDNSLNNGIWSDAGNWADNTEPTLADDVTFPAGFPRGSTSIMLEASPVEKARSLTILDSYSFTGATSWETAELQLADGGSVHVADGKSVVFYLSLTGFSGFTKSGGGLLRLAAPSDFGGDVAIDGGTLLISAFSQLGFGNRINLDGGGILGLTAVSGGAGLITPTGRDITIGPGGGIRLGTSRALGVQRAIAGSGHLTIDGPGILFLEQGSVRTGSTLIQNGHVSLNVASGLGNGPVTVNSGGRLQINGLGTNAQAITLADGAKLIGVGNAQLTGSVTIGASPAESAVTLVSGENAADVLTIGNASNDLTGGGSGAVVHVAGGAGAVVLPYTSNYSGAWSLDSGTLAIAADSSLGASGNAVTLNGGRLRINATIGSKRRVSLAPAGGAIDTNGFDMHLAGITGEAGALAKQGAGNLRAQFIRTGATTVHAGRLSIVSGATAGEMNTAASIAVAPGAKFDLADHKLAVTAQPLAAIESLIASGYNGVAWDGDGIITSMPDAQSGLTTLAVATAAQAGTTTFGGLAVEADDVLVMYTYGGDSNLDGKIDADDYGTMDFNILVPGASGYHNGDFNYDGVINADDYGSIDFNILAQGAPFPTGGSGSGLAGVTAVPEPSACGFAILAAAAARRRRGAANTVRARGG